MPRELMQLGIDQLEKLFNNYPTDPKLLADLASELSHRSMPRAVSLLSKVQQAIASTNGAQSGSASESHAGRSRELQRELLLDSINVSDEPKSKNESTETKRATRGKTQLPALDTKDAHSILKVAASSHWPSIEARRREMIAKVNPFRLPAPSDEDILLASKEAAKLNAAALHLWEQEKRVQPASAPPSPPDIQRASH